MSNAIILGMPKSGVTLVSRLLATQEDIEITGDGVIGQYIRDGREEDKAVEEFLSLVYQKSDSLALIGETTDHIRELNSEFGNFIEEIRDCNIVWMVRNPGRLFSIYTKMKTLDLSRKEFTEAARILTALDPVYCHYEALVGNPIAMCESLLDWMNWEGEVDESKIKSVKKASHILDQDGQTAKIYTSEAEPMRIEVPEDDSNFSTAFQLFGELWRG